MNISSMTLWQLFWLLGTILCVLWYIVITWYVAWRGVHDIKTMLTTIHQRNVAAEKEKNNVK